SVPWRQGPDRAGRSHWSTGHAPLLGVLRTVLLPTDKRQDPLLPARRSGSCIPGESYSSVSTSAVASASVPRRTDRRPVPIFGSRVLRFESERLDLLKTLMMALAIPVAMWPPLTCLLV